MESNSLLVTVLRRHCERNLKKKHIAQDLNFRPRVLSYRGLDRPLFCSSDISLQFLHYKVTISFRLSFQPL